MSNDRINESLETWRTNDQRAGDGLTYAQRELRPVLAGPPPGPKMGPGYPSGWPQRERLVDRLAADEINRRAEWRNLERIRKTTERAEIVSWISLGVGLITLGLVGYWSWKVVELANALHEMFNGLAAS